MTLEDRLAGLELSKYNADSHQGSLAEMKLRWRALIVKHTFHVLPGQSILELGAGSGRWTKHLDDVCRGENPITAAVFNERFTGPIDLAARPSVSTVFVKDLNTDLPANSFDFIVGRVLYHDRFLEQLDAIYRLLKPGGQLLFFDANSGNGTVFRGTAGQTTRRLRLSEIASDRGFVEIKVVPFDMVPNSTPQALIGYARNIAFLLEQTPILNRASSTLYLWARKPGALPAWSGTLATIPALYNSTSVVVPCHNEEMNVPRLVKHLLEFYGPYIHEILIVNDNSKDRTAEVTREIAKLEPRVKLVDRRPPNGVGRALKDGYAAATGRYILSMDSDFVHILPEFRELFDAIDEGFDGAFGSRFSHDSILINYPLPKIICNRGFHFLAKLFVAGNIRDVTNNLKLMRTSMVRTFNLTQPHFAANAETGLIPFMDGFSIKEVPISWINRTVDMGTSKFDIRKIASDYVNALFTIARRRKQKRQ